MSINDQYLIVTIDIMFYFLVKTIIHLFHTKFIIDLAIFT